MGKWCVSTGNSWFSVGKWTIFYGGKDCFLWKKDCFSVGNVWFSIWKMAEASTTPAFWASFKSFACDLLSMESNGAKGLRGLLKARGRTWISAFPSQLWTFYPLQPQWVVTCHKWTLATLAECHWTDRLMERPAGDRGQSGCWDSKYPCAVPKMSQRSTAIFWFHSCNFFVWKLCLYMSLFTYRF